jgi:hypothetical protein
VASIEADMAVLDGSEFDDNLARAQAGIAQRDRPPCVKTAARG